MLWERSRRERHIKKDDFLAACRWLNPIGYTLQSGKSDSYSALLEENRKNRLQREAKKRKILQERAQRKQDQKNNGALPLKSGGL